MQGDARRFDPEAHLRQAHPDVRVYEMRLPGGLQACVNHERRIIWLDVGLSPTERRCAITYEIAQLQQGPTPADPYLAAARRRAAEDWAALMLVPSEEFAEVWGSCRTLAEMADRCGVDLPMWRARMRAASDHEQDAAMAAIEATRLSA